MRTIFLGAAIQEIPGGRLPGRRDLNVVVDYLAPDHGHHGDLAVDVKVSAVDEQSADQTWVGKLPGRCAALHQAVLAGKETEKGKLSLAPVGIQQVVAAPVNRAVTNVRS